MWSTARNLATATNNLETDQSLEPRRGGGERETGNVENVSAVPKTSRVIELSPESGS